MGILLDMPAKLLQRFLIPVLWLLSLAQPLFAQEEERELGGLWAPEAYQALPLLQYNNGVKDWSGIERVSLRPFCPTPGNQGAIGSCTGFALGYGAMTIMEAVAKQETRRWVVDTLAFSSVFLYNQIRKNPKDCKAGSSIEDGIAVLKQYGNCRRTIFGGLQDCQSPPPTKAFEAAAPHRMKEGVALYQDGAPPAVKINAIKNALRDSLPVILNILTYESFIYLPPGASYWQERKNDHYKGLHSLVAVGFDDHDATFELMSSWGPGWADGGFVRMSYENLAEYCLNAYALIPYENWIKVGLRSGPSLVQSEEPQQAEAPTPMPVRRITAQSTPRAILSAQPEPIGSEVFYLQGGFDFINLIETTTGNYKHRPLAVRFEEASGLYVPQAPADTRQGMIFQLVAGRIPAGKYLYVFSCDPKGQVALHWPKTGDGQAGEPGEKVYIPSPDAALQLSHPGQDFLCILYSEAPIQDIDMRLRKIRDYDKSNFMHIFAQAMDGMLIPQEKINFHPQQMVARCWGDGSDGFAFPIVLCLETR